MAIDPSIKVEKTFSYRGATRVFSNRYYFDNLKPADNTKWTTFCDAVVAAEKLIWNSTSGVTITNVLGYDAGSDVPVFSKAYSQAGTSTFANWVSVAGDSVALVRYATAQRSTKNHPIYLYNYYHGVGSSTTLTIGDTLNAAQRTAMQTYAAAWVSGFSDGAVTHHRCGPNGHTATGYTVDQWIRHRDFPAG